SGTKIKNIQNTQKEEPPVCIQMSETKAQAECKTPVGGVTPQQMAVYEEFVRMIPGFLPSGEREQQQANHGRSVAVSDLLVGFVPVSSQILLF
ncbi:hypothetical protein AVEN_194113-1, partial [Araneus ventricosus]